MESARIHITGIVQGVGFRPFVYNLASRHKLRGYCLNDSEGVVIEVQGDAVGRFIDDIRACAPPLSRIESMTVEMVAAEEGFSGFTIRQSEALPGRFALISPDVAVCDDCLSEMLSPSDRRHLYPFINCTNCGPRYSIVQDIPYDRPKTTMAPFRMCRECEREYHDPADRRFHAQPNACPDCGPVVWLEGMRGSGSNFDAVSEAQRLLSEGAILAIKGLGGFHLACDAASGGAVRRLRSRKRVSLRKPDSRGSNKPFALMAPGVDAAASFCELADDEKTLLLDRARPIALLGKKGPSGLDDAIAPGNGRFGVMLPYTPLHHLLFYKAPFRALVMTSGNISDEPIVISNDEALGKLSSIADAFLLHDRGIYMRVDDSIAASVGGRRRLMRRARGFVPEPIDMGEQMDEVFAAGALLKNTFCITKGRSAIVSQHIGDLENYQALEFYRETFENLKSTFRARPSIVAHDLHPDYLSTRFAVEYARDMGVAPERVVGVQHHHAHIVSAMAEHGLRGRVIGIAFDGAGLGADNAVWGGEFLVCDRRSYSRAAHLRYAPLPGGDAAAREPWRMALSYLLGSCGSAEALTGFAGRVGQRLAPVAAMIEKGVNSPPTSSMGRLFDAVASIAGVRDEITFEAEAAIELESLACGGSHEPYPFAVSTGEPAVIDFSPMIRAVVDEVNSGAPAALVSGRFHATVAEMALAVAGSIRERTGLGQAVLSGGVFQNRLLTTLVERKLLDAGFEVYSQERVPSNDGGLSLGQAIAAWEAVKGR